MVFVKKKANYIQHFRASGFTEREKLKVGELRVLLINALNNAWEKMCENPKQMIASFRDVGISLNIDGSEDHQMKFQGQEPGLPSDVIIS